jgi:hypothetical protein
MGPDDDGGEAEREEAAQDRGPDEAPVPGDEDLGVLVGEEGGVRICGEPRENGVRVRGKRRRGETGSPEGERASGGLPAAVTVPMSPEGRAGGGAAAGDGRMENRRTGYCAAGSELQAILKHRVSQGKASARGRGPGQELWHAKYIEPSR